MNTTQTLNTNINITEAKDRSRGYWIDYTLLGGLAFPIIIGIALFAPVALFGTGWFDLNSFMIIVTVVPMLMAAALLLSRYKEYILRDENIKLFSKEWMLGLVKWGAFFITMYLIGSFTVETLVKVFASDAVVVESANDAMIKEMMIASPVIMTLYTAIIGPVVEELSFRASLYEMIPNKKVAIAVTTLTFASAHFLSVLLDYMLYGVVNVVALCYLPAYIALAFALTYIYHKTHKLSYTITLHIINNTISVILMLISLF